MLLNPELYTLSSVDDILTPALLIYPELVQANIAAAIRMAGNDPNRWRPHMKTAKISAVLQMILAEDVMNLKCSTTLELQVACEAGFPDVLLAFPVMGANALRVLEIAELFPDTRLSVLVENSAQAESWAGTEIGLFIDVNTGMNRTGLQPDAFASITALAQLAGAQFRGIHYYDGQLSGVAPAEREAKAHEGYRQLMTLVEHLQSEGLIVEEIITSGTPAAPFAMSFPEFENASFIHRISPGTVVYNDLTSLQQLDGYGFYPAAVVLATVVSHPTEDTVTCDAGHKSVSVDAGVPNCAVIGYENLQPIKPSEEHLPLQSANAEHLPLPGEKVYLIPKHVCPTVNNFDDALFVRDGNIESIEPVSARGHERPLPYI